MHARISDDSPFGAIAFELDKSKMFVQRRYPTFIDMIAKFGGIARLVIITVFSCVSLHHVVVMQKYLLNEAILQKTQEVQQAVEATSQSDESTSIDAQSQDYETRAFSYLEVIKLKFVPCCSKKSYRFKEYREFVDIIYERMDAQSIMLNSGKISFLSTALLQPYHKVLLLELQRCSADSD
jgi:hypothetical protein